MPDKKEYLIQLPGFEDMGRWDAKTYEEKKESLFKKYPKAQVFEVAPYDSKEEVGEYDTFHIMIDGKEGEGRWDAKTFTEKKDKLFEKYPNAKVYRSRSLDYFYDLAKADEEGIEAINAEIDSLKSDFAKAKRWSPEANSIEAKIIEKESARDDLQRKYDSNPRVIEANQRYQEELAAAQEEYEKNYLPNLRTMIRQWEKDDVDTGAASLEKGFYMAGGGVATTYAVSSAMHNQLSGTKGKAEALKQDRYQTALDFLDKAERVRQEHSTFGEGVKDYALSAIESGSTRPEIVTYVDIRAILSELETKLEKEGKNLNDLSAEEIDSSLTQDEKALILAFFEYNSALAEVGEDMSGWYKGGKIASEAVAFMLEFVATGGLASAASKGATKGLSKAFAKWLQKSAAGTFKRGIKKVVAKGTRGTLQGLTRAAIITPLRPTAYTNVAKSMTQIGEDGKLKDSAKDIAQYAANEYIETLSELAGGGLSKIVGAPFKAAKFGIGKAAGKYGGAWAVADNAFDKWGKILSNNQVTKFVKRGQFHGMPVEMAEEYFGNALREIYDPKALDHMHEDGNFMSMVIGFAPMTLIGAAGGYGSYANAKHQANKAAAQLRDKLLGDGFSEDQVNHITNFERELTPLSLGQELDVILKTMAASGANQKSIDAVTKYALAVGRYKALGGELKAENTEYRDIVHQELSDRYGAFSRKKNVGTKWENEVVEQAILNDGRAVFITSELNENGEYEAVDIDTGRTLSITPAEIATVETENGSQPVVNTQSVDSFITSLAIQDRIAADDMRKAYNDGRKMTVADLYDVSEAERHAAQQVLNTGVTERTEAFPEEALNWSAADLFSLLEYKGGEFTLQERSAIKNLALAKEVNSGLTDKLREPVTAAIQSHNAISESASHDGVLTVGTHNGRTVYVKGGVQVSNGSIVKPNNSGGHPVQIVDAETGEVGMVESKDITNVSTFDVLGYNNAHETGVMNGFEQKMEELKHTKSSKAKLLEIISLVGSQVYLRKGEGIIQVFVDQILPSAEVLIKGKKGDLGGQSVVKLGIDEFYDSLYRDSEGNIVFPNEERTEQGGEENAEEVDYRGQTVSILLNGVPVEVEVISQDNASDTIVYEYTDANGNTKTGSSTLDEFKFAIHQAETYEQPMAPASEEAGEQEQPAEEDSTEQPAEETPAPQEVPVTPETIDWDALFEQNPEAYFVELQNQFGEEALDILNEEIIAAQEELDSLDKKRGKTQNERLENRKKKVTLQNRIDTLKGIVARLTAPAVETPAVFDIVEPPVVPMEKDPEPQNAVEFAAREMGLKKGGIKLLVDSFKQYTGYGNNEIKGFFGLFLPKEKGGMTMEQAGERLMELDRENSTGFFDQSDPNAGLNAILEALSYNRTIGELRTYAARQQQAEAQREADAAYSAMMADFEDAYGQPYDVVMFYNEIMDAQLSEYSLSREQYNEYNAILAEEIYQYESEQPTGYQSAETQQGESGQVYEAEDIGDLPAAEGEIRGNGEGGNTILQGPQSILNQGEGSTERETIDDNGGNQDAGIPTSSNATPREGPEVDFPSEDTTNSAGAISQIPVAPNPVANPTLEAAKRERSLATQLQRYGISPEQKADMAFNAGKAVGDLFATREVYEAYTESAEAVDFGGYLEDFERGVEESFANRQQNVSNSPVNSVPLETEPNGENNGESAQNTEGPDPNTTGTGDNTGSAPASEGVASPKTPRSGKGKGGKSVASKYPARKGNATQKLLKDTFGFDSVSIPNSRKETLNSIYDFMMEMSKMLGISPKSIGQGGWLEVASLRSNSSASAQHDLRYRGADTITRASIKFKYDWLTGIAHEWWHSLDHALSYFETGKGIAEATKVSDSRFTGRKETLEAVREVINAIKKSGHPDRIRSFVRSRKDLNYYLSYTEMAARAFDEYINAKFAEGGITIEGVRHAQSQTQPTPEEMAVIAPAFDNLFKVLQEKEGKTPGTSVLYHIGEMMAEDSPAKRLATDAVLTALDDTGIDVGRATDKQTQQMLDIMDEVAEMQKGTAPETASVQEEHHPTVVSSADGAKVLKDLDSAIQEYEEKSGASKTFLGDVAKALGAKKHGSNSQYATFEAKNGKIFTIRLANHNAKVSNYDNHNEEEGISIVVASAPSSGIENDGRAHIVEFYYDAIKLRKAEGKPLVEILKSIKQSLYSGEYRDNTGLAKPQEVNAPELMTVYHGSPSLFDEFDHSHMGEGEGAQAHGWGTYIAKSADTAKAYASMGRVSYTGPKQSYGSYEYEVVEDIVSIMNRGNSFEEAIKIGRRYWSNLRWEPSHRAKRAFLETLTPEDFKLRNLYEVEIPEDNGENYLDESNPTRIQAEKLYDACQKEGLEYADVIAGETLLDNRPVGKKITSNLAKMLGSPQAASEFLSRAGFVGIKYDGRRDGECFVIFNESDAKITGRTEFYQTPNGTVYGWTDGKKIYLTKAGINPNTPIHEYTHLWAKAMMQKNPKGWNSVKQLLKNTPIWNQVMNDTNYSSIHNDEDAVASEALSRISGAQNAAKMEQMAQQMIDGARGTARKLEARGLIQNMRDALAKFWNWVGTNLFGIEKFESVEQITDRVLWDLLNNTDLGTLSEGQVETQIVTDPKVIAELEASPKRTGYRNVVQNEDGTFSSPMAYWLQSTKGGAKTRVETAKFEIGKWEEAEEHPELVDERGHITLVKPNKSTVDVAYDPYIHNRLDPVNLQFKDAWKRNELVYVETEVPETDLESGYHADQALLPVGVHSWSNGDLMLSKYDKPVRIMPWEAVADAWVERLNGEGVHFDVVPPALRQPLVERGVEILPPHKGMGKDCNDAYAKWKEENEKSGFTPREVAAMETPILSSKGTFKNLSEAEAWAKSNLQGKSYVNRFTNDTISISGKSIKEMLNPNATKKINEGVHMAALMSVPDFIETGIPAEQHKDTHGRGFDVVRLYNAINIDGKVYRVKSTVKRLKEGDRYYTYEIQEMELIEDTQSTAVGSDGNPALNSTNSMTGANLLKGVRKTNSSELILEEDSSFADGLLTSEMDAEYLAAVEAGDMETAQRMVIEAARLAMPNTKVVDENGNPKVVYHVTRHEFNTFDTTRADAGKYDTQTPKGVFTSETPDVLPMLGERVVPLFADAKNGITFKNRDELEAYLVDNGYEDSDLRKDEITRFFKERGYDMVVLEDDYSDTQDLHLPNTRIFLYPNQVKSADSVTYDDAGNVIPLSQRFNPENEDIRYRRGEINANFVEQFEFKQNNERQELEYSDEFRRLQEESARMHERDVAEYHRGKRRDSGSVRQRLGGAFRRELARRNIGGGNKILSHVNKSKGTSFDIIENVDGRLFHDIFAIVRNYLPNGELVDLHDNYNDAICYITTDGLAGFAVDKDGNLISVYSYYMQSNPGFLGAIKDLITEAGATHLDGYNSRLQPLEIYSKVFGWKVASMMDYNMEYDHDNIAENHGMPQVAFMVNTEADIETKHFDKDQYDEAVAYQQEQVEVSQRIDAQNAAIDYLAGNARAAAIEHAVNKEAAKLGVKVTYKTRSEMPAGHKNDKGYYNTKTGEIVICTENATSISDAIQTILHEAVAHKGLRQLMGDKFNEFINRVYNSLDAETKAKVDKLAAEQYNGNTAVAMEEYMATLAESENFAENSVWDKIKSIFENIINAILGRKDIKIGDSELRYILRASYNNMVNPRSMETMKGWAQDQMMREDYKINEAAPEILSRTGIDVNEVSSESARQVYDKVVQKGWQEFQRQFQDAYQPVRIAMDAIQQETGNMPIADYENYLLVQNQASSRSRAETDIFSRRYYSPIIEQANNVVTQIIKSRGLKNNARTRAEIYKEVRQYLIAKHGLERNAYYQNTKGEMRDYSGLTALFGLEANEYEEAERLAQELVDNFENEVSTDELWAKINAATNKTLRHSYESGMLSRQQYEQIRDMFDFYIPLRGFSETTAEDVYSYARFEGNNFSPAVKTAKGRISVADDPIAYIMTMAESEIAQGNKNRAKQALYNFLLNRPIVDENGNQRQNSLMQIEDVWYVKSKDDEGKEVYQIAAPNHAIGETYEEFETRMESLAAADQAIKSKKGQVDVGMRFQKKMNENAHYIYLKVNGVDKAIYVNGDPKAADAINGRSEKSGELENAMRAINRTISSTFTNYSLEFTVRNYLRDMIYSHINIAMKESDPAYRKKFRQNWRHNNLGTMLSMLKAYRAGEFDGGRELNEDEKAFVEFMENGGQTGYTLLNSVENHKVDIEKAIKHMRNSIGKGGVKDSVVFRYTLGGIELLNEASELVTRFAAFKTSRDMGRSIVQSVSDAKEITVNFNTKGAQDGIISRYLGAAKYFFNASVQGVQNLKAMASANKLKFCSTVGGIMATGFFMPIIQGALLALLGADDDDYWNIPEYDRQNNFCVCLGGGKYVKIALPIGFREMYAMGDMIAASMFDKRFTRDAKQVGMDFANKIASIVLPINPLEGSANGLSLWQATLNNVLPSFMQFGIQNTTNTDWKGAPLQKEYQWNKDDPQWMKAFANAPDWMVGLSKWCNENINLDGDYRGMDWSPEKLDNTLSNLFGGVYTLIKKTGNGISAAWNEEERNLSNVPLAGVVFGTGIESDGRFVTDAYFDMKDYYDANVNSIKRVAGNFGYSLEDIFVKQKGAHHPKIQEIYGNKNFEWMKDWYLGHEGNRKGSSKEEKLGLNQLKQDIKDLQKSIAEREQRGMSTEKKEKKLTETQKMFDEYYRDFTYRLLEMD